MVPKSRFEVDSVVQGKSSMEEVIAKQSASRTKKMVAKEILTFVTKSLGAVLQSTYKNACMPVRSVICNSVK